MSERDVLLELDDVPVGWHVVERRGRHTLIERDEVGLPALPSAPDHRLRGALANALSHEGFDPNRYTESRYGEARGFVHSRSFTDAATDLARAVLSEATPSSEPALDVDVLARAICGSRPPALPDDYREDMFVDDECRTLARRVAAEYSRLSASQTPGPDIQ